MRDLPKGVYKIKDSYRAATWDSSGKTKHLGLFSTPDDAEYARISNLQGHHWQGEDMDPVGNWGFIYKVTNKTNGKKYIGRKQYRLYNGPPGGYKCTDPQDADWFSPDAWRPNDWEFYTGSSNKLNADMVELGVTSFKFEVIKQCANKLDLHLSEVKEQMARNVLEATGDDGEYLYYNENIAGQEFRPPFRKADVSEATEQTLEEIHRYYLRPRMCPDCNSVIPYRGECTC